MSGRRKEGRNDGQIAIDKGVPQGLWRERCLEERKEGRNDGQIGL